MDYSFRYSDLPMANNTRLATEAALQKIQHISSYPTLVIDDVVFAGDITNEHVLKDI